MTHPITLFAQQTAVTQTQAPQAPPAPPPADAFNSDGVPQTLEAVRSMRAQRGELSDQLTSALGRRATLARQYEEASEAQKPALEARIQQLDERILGIEQEIARTGQLISRAPGQFLTQSEMPNLGPFVDMNTDMTAIVSVVSIFVLAPIAVAVARLIWRRASIPKATVVDSELSDRLRRLEGGVDTIALEVERISEGQRFVTKLLAEREKDRLSAPRQ
jgi:hypothetical protein